MKVHALLRSPATVVPALVSALALAACGGGDQSSSIQTESVRHFESKTPLAGNDLRVSAPDYVHGLNHDLDLGLSANDEYTVLSVSVAGLDGLRHARLQQTYAGVPVVGSEIITHADDTTFLGFNGYVTKHLDGFDINPVLSSDQAIAAAKDDVSKAAPAPLQFSGENSTLVILPGASGKGADLAWQVEFADQQADGSSPGSWRYFVDAHDSGGAVLKKYSTYQTETVEQASGEGGNPMHAQTWTSQLDVVADSDQYQMDTERLKTVDLSNSEMVFKGPLDAMPDSQANDAHGYAEITLNMLRDWMGRDSLDDSGFKIVSRVHDTMGDPQNASWNGSVMTYGNGGDLFYPMSGAIDVVAHELDHGFTQFHSNLAYSGQSGGLNESFSDVAGTTTEFYKEGDSADFDILEDVYKPGGGFRFMCDPTADQDFYKQLGMPGSIDNASDFKAGMDPHFSSGVPNRAFCLAVGRYKAGPAGAGTTDAVRHIAGIWFEANASYWTSGSTYADACQGTVDAARALGFSGDVVAEIGQSWADVGVACEAASSVCNGDGTCDGDAGESCASCPDDCGACSESCSGWKKFKCKLGIGDCSLCDKPAGCGDGLCDGDESDSSCPQDCGCASPGYTCGDNVPAPFGCYCDPLCQQYGDCCADSNTCGN